MLRFRRILHVGFQSKKSLPIISVLTKYQLENFSSDSDSSEYGKDPKKPLMPQPSIRRALNILRQDFKDIAKGKFKREEHEIFPHYCDVVIIGGGVVGCSIAYWLKQRAVDSLRTVVIERDPTYTRCSTALSIGGMRQQFSSPENIAMSMHSAEFLRNIRSHLSVLDRDPPEVFFNPHGYLCLASEEGASQMEENFQTQKSLGGQVELLSPQQLKEKFSWLNTQGIALGCHGLGNEGWFDPCSLLNAFRMKAASLGTIFLDAELTGFEFETDGERYVTDDEGQRHPVESLKRAVVKTEDGEYKAIQFALAIIAAGAHSGEIGRMAKIGTGPSILKHPIPVEPRKRYVYVYHCSKGPGLECPLLIDSSGAYFRREGLGGNFLGGKSPLPNEEPDVANLDVDYAFFEKQVWPLLANRVPCFEAIKLKTAWAGYYDYNYFDQNGIIGAHPYYHNLYLATGFSGHGIQQAPAVGRAIAELILDAEFTTIDLSRFQFQRIVDNEPVFEKNVF